MSSPCLYVFFGLIASGKSTLATRFADDHGLPCYNTDRVRKELAGLAATERRAEGMGQGIYTPEFTERTYRVMLERCRRDLAEGAAGVVLDGSYSRRADRHRVLTLADQQGCGVIFILCFCSDAEVRRRLAIRARDPDAVSDGRWEIYELQKQSFEEPDELDPSRLLRLDTESDPEFLLARIERFAATLKK